jgi:hypothetical protein
LDEPFVGSTHIIRLQRDKDTRLQNSCLILAHIIRLDAHKRCEDSPEPAAREDYSHKISRSNIEIIAANTWIEITIFIQWSPILKEISITTLMAMAMQDIGDATDEQWWMDLLRCRWI